MDDERIAYLALTQVPGMGPVRLQTLLTACKTALGAHSAPIAFLAPCPGFPARWLRAVKATPLETGRKLAEDADRLGAQGHHAPAMRSIRRSSGRFRIPRRCCSALGNISLLLRPAAAIVGSRDHSSYGAAVVPESWRRPPPGQGWSSSAAWHEGSMPWRTPPRSTAGGSTIGVLGNGLGVIYPAANRALYDRVAARRSAAQ